MQTGSNCGSDACAACGENIWGDAIAYKWSGVAVEADPMIYQQLVGNYKEHHQVMTV